MSLFGEYLKERTDKNIIETDKGFVTYYFTDKGCVAEDIYVAPRHRKQKIAFQLLDELSEIAKSQGCTKLFGSCVPTANGSTDSLKFALSYGFNLLSSTTNFIVLMKELG